MNYQRRKSDQSALGQLRITLLEGDISMTLLLGGVGLILWALFGFWKYTMDLDQYTNMFPFGNTLFWMTNYIGCGIMMWYLVATRYPPFASLITGGWIMVLWSWSFFARAAQITTQQTGNATSMVYIILGMLIIHRSASRK